MEGIVEELKAEIKRFKENYNMLKDFLIGAHYDIINVREILYAIKDGLSKIKILFPLAIYTKTGKSLELPLSVDSVQRAIDLALVLMGDDPKQARVVIQMMLALSTTKLEDLASLFDVLATL